MPCYHPIHVKHKKAVIPVIVPCGRCIGCRLERSRQWAVRCVHEMQLYDQNCFITLTYKPGEIPDRGLSKAHLQQFFKQLRKVANGPLRYFSCGEYGERFKRPHYHAIVFNYRPCDLVELGAIAQLAKKDVYSGKAFNQILFTSEILENIWGKGFVSVGEASFETAGYVARYVVKKVVGDEAFAHYGQKWQPEFSLMSRKPGIGADWLKKYQSDVYPKDGFHLRGVLQRPPRFYDEIYKKDEPETMERIKEKRKKKQKRYLPMRQKQKENFRNVVIKQLKRKVDDGNSSLLNFRSQKPAV